MCLAQGPQRSDACEARTRDPSVSIKHSTTEPLRSLKVNKFFFRYDSYQKADNKVADETALMHRLICALIVTNHQRQVFSVAVQLLYVSFYHERLENKMRNLIIVK